MSLVIFTAMIGAFMAPGSMHPYIFFVSILCIAIGAGASGAYNMAYDHDVDAIMQRTKKRPIPAGRLTSEDAVIMATILSCGAVATLALATNWLAATLLAFTIFFYAVIYTIWLKRRTPQNIVIGGAAGAFPPMIGWAAVTGDITIEPVILFAIIFFWTPPHFWALALFTSKEYQDANIPMLPVTAGIQETKKQILLYSGVLFLTSLAPFFIGMSGLFYISIAVLMGLMFMYYAWRVKQTDNIASAKKLFWFSIFYLFTLYLAIFIDKLIGGTYA